MNVCKSNFYYLRTQKDRRPRKEQTETDFLIIYRKINQCNLDVFAKSSIAQVFAKVTLHVDNLINIL